MAPGLTEPQFFDWLSAVAMECKALTTKKTFGHSPQRSRSKGGRDGPHLRGKIESGRLAPSKSDAASARRNAAKTVVLLQWMEVSRGMRKAKREGIPPFRLSACLTSGRPHS